MAKSVLLSILLLILIHPPVFCQEITTIDIVAAYKNRDRLNLSTFAKSIEYVPLETTEETLYSYPAIRGIQGDSIILVKSRSRISLFDRNTGTFIKDIGHIGNDPNSFQRTGPLGFNTTNGHVFAQGKRGILEFDITSNKVVSKTSIPDLSEMGGPTLKSKSGGSVPTQINMLRWSSSGYFVGEVQNTSGREKIKLVLFNPDGEIMHIYKNHREYQKKDLRRIRLTLNSFYEYDNHNFTKERYSDTVFVFDDKKIEPKYVFNTGRFSFPYAQQDELTEDQRKRYMLVNAIQEDSRFVYFDVLYQGKWVIGAYDKISGETRINEAGQNGLMGFYNDLDNFLPFVPKFITPEGKMVGTISAEDVLLWFEENRKKAKALPPSLQKLSQLDPEDNPVVMIVTPKY